MRDLIQRLSKTDPEAAETIVVLKNRVEVLQKELQSHITSETALEYRARSLQRSLDEVTGVMEAHSEDGWQAV